MHLRTFVSVALAAVSLVPVWAMDSLNMPTGNFQPAGRSELNFILVTQPRRANMQGNTKIDDMYYTKLFTGITDRLNLDIVNLNIKDAAEHTIVNAYFRVLDETPERPAVTVGVSNLTGSDWLGGTQYGGDSENDNPYVFAVLSYTALKSRRPSLTEPVVRLHVGWGDGFHDEKLFGQVQFRVHPRVGGFVQSYRELYAVGLTWFASDGIAVSSGLMDDEAWYRLGTWIEW